MKPARIVAIAVLAAAPLAAWSCSTGPAEPAPAPEEAALVVEDEAPPAGKAEEDASVEPILRAMSEALRNAKSLSFRVEAWSDESDDDGICASVGSESQVLLRRPDRLVVDRVSEKGHRVARYDGTSFTLCDLDRGVHASVPARATIDETLDMLHDDYGLVVPLADLFVGDPYAAYTTVAEKALNLGVRPVRGVACHQIALSTSWLAWQLWIPVEGTPLPRRVEIRYLDEPGAPRYVANLDDWKVDPPTTEEDFRFVPPEGSEPIEIRKREADEPAASEAR
jgi:hypothetical protein